MTDIVYLDTLLHKDDIELLKTNDIYTPLDLLDYIQEPRENITYKISEDCDELEYSFDGGRTSNQYEYPCGCILHCMCYTRK